MLTGVDLTAYGADLPGGPSLGRMARLLLAAVPELPRLRLSSLDPSEIDEDLWALLATEARLMPHLHLSLQAGDDLILKRMKRRHSRAQAIAAAARARALRPEIMIGADLIAGFPTESEEMFRRSLDICRGMRPRLPACLSVQPAAGHPGRADAAARLRRSCASAPPGCAPPAQRRSRPRWRARVGGRGDVLIEGPGRGRADCYAAVRFEPRGRRRRTVSARSGACALSRPTAII